MGKVDYRTLTRQQRGAYRRELLQTFERLGLDEQGQELLSDMITESEVTMFARRLVIARRLLLGQSLPEIAKELSVSHHTVRVVDRWLEGKFDAYRSILTSVLQESDAKAGRRRGRPIQLWALPDDPSLLKRVRDQYPEHFFLLSALLNYPLVYPRRRTPRAQHV